MLNKDTENYLKSFKEREFSEYNFTALFLRLLHQNGVYVIDEWTIEEKLFYYYKNPNFRELFQDIAIENLPSHKAIILHDSLYREKYFGNGICFDTLQPDILNLFYPDNTDLSYYEQALSEDGKLKIRQLAYEFALRYKAECNGKVKTNILGINPNCSYDLIHGYNKGKELGFELITDGDIVKLNKPDMKGLEHLYYTSPYNYREAIQLEDNKVIYVTLKNATYAIKQGFCNGKICYATINTLSLDPKELDMLVEMANQKYDDTITLNKEEPFIHKLSLK